MARFVHTFPVPLGGIGLSQGKPWIVNLNPPANAQNVALLRPVRFSVRDAETYIDPARMLVEVGYAKAHAFSTSVDAFDKIAKTKKVSLQPGLVHGDADLLLISSGIKITKTAAEPQRSTYATAVPAGSGYASAMVSALVRPDTIETSASLTYGPLFTSAYPGPLLPLPFSAIDVALASGAVIGLEHGPRNKVVYLFLCNIGGSPYLQLSGYRPKIGDTTFNLVTPYNWASGFQRYTIVWNEAYGYVEVYVDRNGSTVRAFRLPISSIPDTPADYFARFALPSEVVGLFGQEGAEDNSSTWKNIAVTTDVGYPILGNIRPGSFRTTVQGAELLRTGGRKDPRDLDIGCWTSAPETFFPNLDPAASSEVVDGVFKMVQPTTNKTFVIYREEPGLLRSSSDGFMIQGRMVAKPTRQDMASTGMGFVIYDGRSYFQVLLFDDFDSKSLGYMRRFGQDSDVASYHFPSIPVDWSKDGFRFVVDPRYKRIKMYSLSDLSTPAMSLAFDRDALPNAADRGLTGATPFVAFGHITPTPSMGTLELTELTVCHFYQDWEAVSGLIPNYVAVSGSETKVDPRFTLATSGSPSAAIVDGVYRVSTGHNETLKQHRVVSFSVNRGGAVEASVRITSFKPRTRTGVYLILDDGNTAYSLAFVDTSMGKFAVLSYRDDFGGFKEVISRDGKSYSFPCDWTKFHTYRIEKKPFAGVQVFLDSEPDPKIVFPEAKVPQLPDEQFGGFPSIGFGHFTGDLATSEWKFVRGFFSGGYEISFKKNKEDKILRDELFGTQAIVVAYVEDED